MEEWSNERMRDERGGKRKMDGSTTAVLDAATAALVRVAAALAHGAVPELKARFAAARDARVPGLWIEELLLQSILVVGYPLALVAFGVWRAVGGPLHGDRAGAGGAGAGAGAENLAHEDWESWAVRGA